MASPKLTTSEFFLKSKHELIALASSFGIDCSASMKKSEIQSLLFDTVCSHLHSVPQNVSNTLSSQSIDIIKSNQQLMSLLPKFKEREAHEFFEHFEKLAVNFGWPEEIYNTLIQGQLTGPAREVYNGLQCHEINNFQLLKTRVLQVYGCVPEHYRHSFREVGKDCNITWQEFSRSKSKLFSQWLTAAGIDTLEKLKNAIEIENLKQSFSTELRLFVEEKGNEYSTAAELAHLCDNFELIHKQVKKEEQKNGEQKRSENGAGSSSGRGRERNRFFKNRSGFGPPPRHSWQNNAAFVGNVSHNNDARQYSHRYSPPNFGTHNHVTHNVGNHTQSHKRNAYNAFQDNRK